MAAPPELTAHGQTDCGRRRPQNEDHFLIAHLARVMTVRHTSLPEAPGTVPGSREGVLLAVADGMGGHADGEVASALAVDDDEIAHHVTRDRARLDVACARLIEAANDAGGRDNITVVLAGATAVADGGSSGA